MTTLPKFSITVTDHNRSVPRDLFLRKMACLAAQTCKDFEVLVYHDGPKQVPYEVELRGQDVHPASTFVVTDGRCCRTLAVGDSQCKFMGLDEPHDLADTRPPPHDELVQLHCLASQARAASDLAGQTDDLARAA